MASPKTIEGVERIERVTWVLIYVGLFIAITGFAVLKVGPGTAWTLISIGGVLVVAGAVLIWVRSRFDEGTIHAKAADIETPGAREK